MLQSINKKLKWIKAIKTHATKKGSKNTNQKQRQIVMKGEEIGVEHDQEGYEKCLGGIWIYSLIKHLWYKSSCTNCFYNPRGNEGRLRVAGKSLWTHHKLFS